jgi:hypothetical protein
MGRIHGFKKRYRPWVKTLHGMFQYSYHPHKRDFGEKRAKKVAFVNPKGIQIYQPKVAELARLPWVGIGFFLNPNGVASAVSLQFLIQLLQSWFDW